MDAPRKRRLTSWQRRRAKSESGEGAKGRKERSVEEARLNFQCAEAKSASESARWRHRMRMAAQPGDVELVAAYSAAKQQMRAFQAAKTGEPAAVTKGKRGGSEDGDARAEADMALPPSKKTRPPTSSAPAPEPPTEAAEPAGVWTCELCAVTIRVRADGRAKEQHLNGKVHARKLLQAASSGSTTTTTTAAPAAAPAAAETREADGRRERDGEFTCVLCSFQGKESDRAAHEASSKHRERVAQLASLLASVGTLNVGDWICTRRKAHPGRALQRNFASKERCGRCDAPRASGLSREEALRLTAEC